MLFLVLACTHSEASAKCKDKLTAKSCAVICKTKNSVCKSACSKKNLCPINYCALAQADVSAAVVAAEKAVKHISAEIKGKNCITSANAKTINTYNNYIKNAKKYYKMLTLWQKNTIAKQRG